MAAAGPIGFACTWERRRELTWSGTPWRLFQALSELEAVADLGPDPAPMTRHAIKLAFLRRRGGRWVTTWKWSAGWDRWSARAVSRGARALGCRAVVQVQDMAVVDAPYYVWQDLSVGAALEAAAGGGALPGFEAVSLDRLARRRERQERIYARAQGLLPMSRWLARRLAQDGTPPERIHVLHPGANIAGPDGWPALAPVCASVAPARLLFVGRDFRRKGGDAVVSAFAALRTRRPELELTVIGPRTWPLEGAPPAGVRFLGPQPATRVVQAMREHDAFLMPSRFEAFGIAPAEALCCGLPALVRDAYAMPEVVTHGVDGVVVASLEREELMHGIEALLDVDLRRRAHARAPAARAYWSWSRAARDLVAILDRDGLGTSR